MGFLQKSIIYLFVVTFSFTAFSRQLTPEEQASLSVYKAGKDFESQGKYKQALGSFEKAYAVYPNPYIRYHIGICHYKLGACKLAMSILKGLDIRRIDPQYRNAVDKNRRAMMFDCLARKAGNLAGVKALNAWLAAANWANAQTKFSTLSRLRELIRTMVNGYVNKAGFEKVQKIVNWTIENKAMNTTQLARLRAAVAQAWAKTCEDRGDWECADTQYGVLKAAAGILASDSMMTLAQAGLARCADRLHDYPTLTTNARAGYLLYDAGKTLYKKGEFRMALDRFRKSAILYDDPHIHLYEGLCLLRLEKTGAAARALAKIGNLDAKMGFGLLREALANFAGLRPKQYFSLALDLQDCTAKPAECGDIWPGWTKRGIDGCTLFDFLVSKGWYAAALQVRPDCNSVDERTDLIVLFGSMAGKSAGLKTPVFVKGLTATEQGKYKTSIRTLSPLKDNAVAAYLIASGKNAMGKCTNGPIPGLPPAYTQKLEQQAQNCMWKQAKAAAIIRFDARGPGLAASRALEKHLPTAIKAKPGPQKVVVSRKRPKPLASTMIFRKARGHRHLRPYAYTATALAVAALGVGAGLIIKANMDINNIQSDINGPNPPGMTDVAARYNSARSLRNWGWVSLGISGALTTTAVVLWVLDAKSAKKGRAMIMPTHNGLVFFTRF